jgi:GT2 family glycosyltransferase
MRVLVVVHGFPPRAQGGAEIYADAHARALRARHGDEILVLTREQDPGRPEYDVRTEQRGDLRIVWVNNTFRATRTFAETYRNEAIGAIADRVIDEFSPDVAHVHHLTCLSTTIVQSLAARGIPRVVTLHDYWLMCHRGQLLDADYRVCDGPGSGDTDCGRCVGVAGGAGAAGFLGAAAVRALERGLPEAPARHLRRAAAGLAAVAFSAGEADDQARRRVAHMREVCQDVTHFLAPSRHTRDRFVQFGIEPERISLSPYGVDVSGVVAQPFRAARAGLTAFAKASALEKPCATVPKPVLDRPTGAPLRVGFLGTLMVSKGAHVLLEAVRALPAGSVSIDLYGAYAPYHGDDSYRQRLDLLLRHDDVRVHGSIAHEDVGRVLSSIDVLVVPSIWPEVSGLVINEAFLAGVPVVASRIGGIPEVVDEGRNGLLFHAGDSAGLAAVLTRLRSEPGLLDVLRGGIPAVRSIDDDVDQARGLYLAHASRRSAARAPAATIAVVLNHRTPDDTFLAVKSLLASRRPLAGVIVVDNDDDSSYAAARAALGAVWSRISYLRTGRNLGYSGGMNAGIREALARGAERVLLMNSDVIVPPDCLERLERSLEAVSGAGIAGPVVLARSEPDRIASLGMSYAPASGRMRHRAFGTLLAAAHVPAASVVDGVSGCCMLVTRAVFGAVGLLDEDYFFSFEDLDFCMKARQAGFATVLAGTAAAYHEGGRSIGAASPRRLYFAARNHLLLARRRHPDAGGLAGLRRTASIVALNVAHAVRSRGGSLPVRLAAVVRGTRDYFAGRFGAA